MSKVIDLDILRPDSKLIKLGGKEIDVSFIPCGITFELDSIVQQLLKVDVKKVRGDKKALEDAFRLSVQLCAVFCSHSNPELDEEWFRKNTDAGQIAAFTGAIQESLFDSYSGIKRHTKN